MTLTQTDLHVTLGRVEDFDEIWPFFKATVATGDTYPYFPEIDYEEGKRQWFSPEKRTYVARLDGKIVGSYYLRDSQPGLASHVVNGGYMVDPAHRGQGLGRKLGEHSLHEAKRLGYTAMQYNMVVSTNTVGVNLWKSLGFEILATLPKAYNHRQLGFVDAYLMFRSLDDIDPA